MKVPKPERPVRWNTKPYNPAKVLYEPPRDLASALMGVFYACAADGDWYSITDAAKAIGHGYYECANIVRHLHATARLLERKRVLVEQRRAAEPIPLYVYRLRTQERSPEAELGGRVNVRSYRVIGDYVPDQRD